MFGFKRAARVQPGSILGLSDPAPAASPAATGAAIRINVVLQTKTAVPPPTLAPDAIGAPRPSSSPSSYYLITPSAVEVERTENGENNLPFTPAESAGAGAVAIVPNPVVIPEAPAQAESEALRLQALASFPLASGAGLRESDERNLGPVARTHPKYVRPRKYPRYDCSGGVTAYVRGASYRLWGQLDVISLGGCYVYTTAPFAPQTELELLIGALGIELKVQGRVTNCDQPLGMGVMFTKMSQPDSEQLQHLLTLAATRPSGQFATTAS